MAHLDPEEAADLDLEVQENAYSLVNRAFSPSSPITDRQLFAGRAEQMGRLLDVVESRGQHALVYGDRGVGKTSLVKVVMRMVEGIPVLYTCNSGDTFSSIWHQVLRGIQWTAQHEGPGFVPAVEKRVASALEMLTTVDPGPADVRTVLGSLAAHVPLVIFIDEFDRPQSAATRTLMADTIKILSDDGADVTLVLVGVAESVGDLVQEHLSIGRALAQIQMPLMGSDELAEIVEKGMQNASLSVETGFIDKVVQLSQGLPHFTHLIAQHGARVAVEEHRSKVFGSDSKVAVKRSLDDVSQTIREAYHRATYSNRDTLYKDVLLACAMAQKNAVGQFDSRGVSQALFANTGRHYEIPAISGHLSAFSDPDHARGGILQKLGSRARYDYRFVDPLMPPYVMMQGHASEVI